MRGIEGDVGGAVMGAIGWMLERFFAQTLSPRVARFPG